jgi:arginyl-tRNA synthetase
MKGPLQQALRDALDRAAAAGAIPAVGIRATEIPVTVPEKQFGDFATSLPMSLAKEAKRPPREVADAIVAHLDRDAVGAAEVSIAGAGFVNFRMAPAYWHRLAAEMATGPALGIPKAGTGRRVQVEFVSANPTGPLHVGHARNAAVGDVVASLLAETGWKVEREYYLNDHGTQMDTLGRSTLAHYLTKLGRTTPLPENGYKGDYVGEVAAEAVARWGDRYLDAAEEDALPEFRGLAGDFILEGIREDLLRFGVRFDVWFRESELHATGAVEATLDRARSEGVAYENEGATWFATSRFGDDKDRVVVRSTGEKTYYAADIAYLEHKFARGFDRIIDVWGKDHHGYVPRMMAALRAFGHPDDAFAVILVTLVNLLRGGEIASMSTRSGEFLTLREIMDEVGVDASRYFLLRRRSDSPLDFDLALAVQQSQENPVYYVQYAHARIRSIFGKASAEGFAEETTPPDLSGLTEPEEFALIRHLAHFPETVAEAAARLEPHRLTFYLEETAAIFHPYYNRHRIMTPDPALSRARLFLCHLTDRVLLHGLRLLGVSTPDSM